MSPSTPGRHMLWIDGVGSWMLCHRPTVYCGGPSQEVEDADICILANISRRHAAFHRLGETWMLEPLEDTSVNDVPVIEQTLLSSGDIITLANRVRLGFRQPSALSSTAVLDFESDHRPPYSVDGVILMADHCLLGPGRDHHVPCNHWTETLVMFQRDDQLMCRSRGELKVNGNPVENAEPVGAGSVIDTGEFRMRIE